MSNGFVLYGAGKGCQRLLSGNTRIQIYKIVDRDPSLWGNYVENHLIIPISKLNNIDYNGIIITIDDIDDAIKTLIHNNVYLNKMFIYDVDNDRITELQNPIGSYYYRNEWMEAKVREIKMGLLRRYDNYENVRELDSIFIKNGDEDYDMILRFLCQRGFKGKVIGFSDIKEIDNEQVNLRKSRIFLTDDKYLFLLSEAEKMGIAREKMVIVPMYDVRGAFVAKKWWRELR